MDMLVLAEMDGVVDMTPEAISARTRIPLQTVIKNLDELEKPDPRSRSKKHDGARIVKIDPDRGWGWQIVNYDDYRSLASEEQRREKDRNRQRKHREQKKLGECHAPVTLGHAGHAMQMQKQMQKQREWEVELPHNFPKSPEEAVRQCEGTMCNDHCFITKLYNSAMSKNGNDGSGHPILSFRHYVAKHWPGEVSRREEKRISGADKIVLGKEYERVIQAIKDLRASYGDHQDMDASDRGKLKKLTDRRNELRPMLGIVI